MAAVLLDFRYLDFRYAVRPMGNNPELAWTALWLPVLTTSVAGQLFSRPAAARLDPMKTLREE